MIELSLIDGILFAAMALMIIGGIGMTFPRKLALITRLLYPLGALICLGLAGMGVVGMAQTGAQTRILPLGLPDLPFHLRLDALSSFFLFLLGAASVGISTYAAGYFRQYKETVLGLPCFLYHLFIASMIFVMLADDGYAFMVAWESMALSSFFL